MTDTTKPNDFGCPNTEMRTHQAAFEEAVEGAYDPVASGLKLHMKKDAPHYSNSATRIAYMVYIADLPTKQTS